MKIEELDLSVGTYNRLKFAGISTVEQLTEIQVDDLLRIKNIGKRHVAEIVKALQGSPKEEK